MPSVHHKGEARTKQRQKITHKKYDSKKKASIVARIDSAHVFERRVSLWWFQAFALCQRRRRQKWKYYCWSWAKIVSFRSKWYRASVKSFIMLDVVALVCGDHHCCRSLCVRVWECLDTFKLWCNENKKYATMRVQVHASIHREAAALAGSCSIAGVDSVESGSEMCWAGSHWHTDVNIFEF